MSLCSNSRKTIPLWVVKLTNEPQKVHKNTCAAKAESVESKQVLSISSTASDDRLTLPEAIKPTVEQCRDHLSAEQIEKLYNLLISNQSVFSMTKFDLGLTNMVQHTINTQGSKPLKLPPRRVPLALRKEVEEEIQKMLDADIIQPSCSPWSTNMVVVRKPDSTIRFCLDYRALNDVTVKNSYMLPRVDDSLDALRGNIWLSTVDLSSGYYQVGMNPSHAQKTAFTTPKGLFEFKRMPMGLSNACATFERLTE